MTAQLGDPDFASKIVSKKEYQIYRVPEIPVIENSEQFEDMSLKICGSFEKMLYQHFIQHYLSRHSQYNSLLMYHGLGVGKTCSAITLAESLLVDHRTSDNPKIIVISSEALHKSFEDQIYHHTTKSFVKLVGCNGDLYKKLIHGDMTTQTFKKKVAKLIRSRYKFITYSKIGSLTSADVNNKLIIIDEAHNLRQTDTEIKEASEALERLLKNGTGNKLLLLSATPMYNEADEILFLLNLLLLNDKREPLKKMKLFKKSEQENEKAISVVKKLASEYISFIKGANPFTMPVRISPTVNNIKTMPIDGIDDYIVPSKLSDTITIEANPTLSSFQQMNIKFPTGSGKAGFNSIFSTNENETFGYRAKYVDYLLPTSLAKVAPKFKTILDIISKSTGTVLVYSQFLYNGILPFAVCLEHLGMKRYNEENVMKGKMTVEHSSLSGMHYTMITGQTQFQGLQELINKINDQKIKVVLITPVASEGLNFKNIREVHIIDPWYHINRIEQIIGRAIRTCSHIKLPLDERNVTVYMHVAVSDNVDTPDIHAYKIAATKIKQIKTIENIIREHSLDCELMKNVNSFPQDRFKFSIYLKTSQGHRIEYKYGDNGSNVCVHKSKKKFADNTFRIDLYSTLINTIQNKLKTIIEKDQDQSVYYNIQDFIDTIGIDEDLVLYALSKVVNESEGQLRFYGNYVIKQRKLQNSKTMLEYKISPPTNPTDRTDPTNFNLPELPLNPNLSLLAAYTVINSSMWGTFATKMISGDNTNYAKIFEQTGALVRGEEINIPSKAYVGYVDIFDTDKLNIKIVEATNVRQAKENEIRLIKSKRTEVIPDETKLYGVLYPTGFSKDPNQPKLNKLKLFVPGKRTRGAMCDPKKVSELKNILETVSGTPQQTNTKNRDELCYNITHELAKLSMLYTYPFWKPTKI